MTLFSSWIPNLNNWYAQDTDTDTYQLMYQIFDQLHPDRSYYPNHQTDFRLFFTYLSRTPSERLAFIETCMLFPVLCPFNQETRIKLWEETYPEFNYRIKVRAPSVQELQAKYGEGIIARFQRTLINPFIGSCNIIPAASQEADSEEEEKSDIRLGEDIDI